MKVLGFMIFLASLHGGLRQTAGPARAAAGLVSQHRKSRVLSEALRCVHLNNF